MISVWHLLWIVPLSALGGAVLLYGLAYKALEGADREVY